MTRARAALALAGLGLAACAEADASADERASRYGILSDLILYRPEHGGAFFLDRFETTRQDWWSYLRATRPGSAAAPWGEGPPAAGTEYLPVARVTLEDARRFARWRFCRLPRYEEWQYAATGRGGYLYPWGDRFTPAWVNSAELGLASPTPVGTFESGRDREGAYDLLGNVAEWTETVLPHWFAADPTRAPAPGEPAPPHGRLARARAGMLGRWQPPALPWPAHWWLQSLGPDLPRLVVGGHFRSFLGPEDRAARRPDGLRDLWERAPAEKGDTVGIRLATGPRDLLRALLAEPRSPTPGEAAALRAFLRRPECRRVLAPALRQLGGSRPDGPLGAVLAAELAR